MAAMNTNSQRALSASFDLKPGNGRSMPASRKERRSGSRRTVESYSHMLRHFLSECRLVRAVLKAPTCSAGPRRSSQPETPQNPSTDRQVVFGFFAFIATREALSVSRHGAESVASTRSQPLMSPFAAILSTTRTS